MGKIKNKKSEIERFWWLHNTSCWRIERSEFADVYFYVPTKRYVMKSSCEDVWYGMKKLKPMYEMTKEEYKTFESELDALKWFSKGEYK